MFKYQVCAALLILCGLGFECSAQTHVEQVRQERLKTMMTAIGVSVDETLTRFESRNHREVHLIWEADPSNSESLSAEARQDSFGHVLKTTKVETRAGALPRQRSLELSRHQLMVIAVNASGKLRWWTLIEDPRVLRAEGADSLGELSGQVLYRSRPEFIVQIPEDQTITELRFYHPRWTGEEFVLDLINTISAQ